MPPPILRNAGLKLLSVVLAALLWLVVSGEQIVERALRVPLEFTNLPAQLELVGDPPNLVDVRVRGSSGTLSRIAGGELVAILDLHAARPGQRLFHLSNADVRTPFGIQVVQVTPSNVSIRFEASVTKVVPVVPGVEGEPASGYAIGMVTADPAMVEVIGPSSALNGLTEAITEPVSVAGASKPVVEMVTIGSPDPLVRLRTPQMATVTVAVTAAPVEWAVGGVTVQVRNAGRPVEVTPRQVLVYVRGAQDLREVGAGEFDASVDVSGLPPGQFDLTVRIVPPSNVGVVRVEPAMARVRIR
jgi:YbbR domain-containing protein